MGADERGGGILSLCVDLRVPCRRGGGGGGLGGQNDWGQLEGIAGSNEGPGITWWGHDYRERESIKTSVPGRMNWQL